MNVGAPLNHNYMPLSHIFWIQMFFLLSLLTHSLNIENEKNIFWLFLSYSSRGRKRKNKKKNQEIFATWFIEFNFISFCFLRRYWATISLSSSERQARRRCKGIVWIKRGNREVRILFKVAWWRNFLPLHSLSFAISWQCLIIYFHPSCFVSTQRQIWNGIQMQREINWIVPCCQIHRCAKQKRTQKCRTRTWYDESLAASENHSTVWCLRVQ